jgi:anti-sigma factor RsiW
MRARPIDHEEANERFSPYVDRELSPDDERELVLHLRACDACRADYERFVRALSLVRGAERARPAPGFGRRVAGRLRVRRRRDANRAVTVLALTVSIEAIIPLLLAVGVAALLILLAP